MSEKQGRVIAIDGPDGVGKSEQVKLLAKHLKDSGKKVHVTRSSGGTPMGLALRKASLTNVPRHPETDLYTSLAMGVDLGADIQRRKAKGETIIVDRSPLTVIAYQVHGSGLENTELGYAACKKLFHAWQIDDLLVLHAAENVLRDRRKEREKEDAKAANNYFELQGDDFHQRTQEGYKEGEEFIKQEPTLKGLRISDIDANPSIAEVQQSIQEALGYSKL